MDDLMKRLLRGVTFVEAHLDEPLDLGQVAKQAALSTYHFHRLFRARFGIPVMEYVRSRRLSIVAERLLQKKTRILDLALDAGFESQAAFTRAFSRMYRTSPAAYRRRGKHLPWRSVAQISDGIVNLTTKGKNMEPTKTIKRGKFYLAGIGRVFSAETRPEIPALWDRFIPQMKTAKNRVTNFSYGVCDAAPSGIEGEFEYSTCVEVSDPKQIPSAWKVKEISGRYLVFTHRGPISQFTKTVDYLWGTWLPNSKYQLRKAPDLEFYDERFTGEAKTSEVEIWIPIE